MESDPISSIRWNAVLGIGTLPDANDYEEYNEKCDCRKHPWHTNRFVGNRKTVVFIP